MDDQYGNNSSSAAGQSQTITKAEVQQAWTEYRITEKHGVELGRVLWVYRDAHKSKGGFGSEGKGLTQLLEELSIPPSTAYWWINRYEVSVGLKAPKETQLPPVPSAQDTPPCEAEGETRSECETDPEPEPQPERGLWDRSKERYKGRNDPPLTDDTEIERLAIKIANAGYEALMAKGGDGEYRTHLFRAHEVAKDMIKAGFKARNSSTSLDQQNNNGTLRMETAA